MTPPSRPRLLSLARHDVVTVATLAANGITEEERRTLLRREHLFPAHRGVFYVTDRPTLHGVWLAAVLHCGLDALLGFESAAVLRQLLERDVSRPHVVVPHRRITKPPATIRVHRSRTLREEDRDEVDGIPVTSLFRTYDDLARRVNDPTLKRALRNGEYRYGLDVAELHAAARTPRLRRFLRTYVAGQGKGESPAEALFLEVCCRSALPSPQKQHRTAGGRTDFLWPLLGLIVEVDGYAAHRGRIAFQEDRTRDRRNFREGRITLRFTYADLRDRPDEVVEDLDAAHARLGSPNRGYLPG